ncbi:hypothetical protein [Nostoc sp. C057]|uniref:hypothetical protein n=1 Tax=Nostoc sp. C057 TaxID=2576903 RepID=UPI0021177003|nr:hypothetical protein [Nostoc sp. C057]
MLAHHRHGVRGVLVLRSVNTKGKRDTREIQVHPKLKQYGVVLRKLSPGAK